MERLLTNFKLEVIQRSDSWGLLEHLLLSSEYVLETLSETARQSP